MAKQSSQPHQIQVADTRGMRYCPVVLASNGRVKPDIVLVNGKQERHPEGAYYLEWRETTKRVRLSVGNRPNARSLHAR